MSAKAIILGALIESPVHGYDLKKRVFRKVFGDFGINDGQLYPLLKKMEGDGLIRKEVVPQEGTPNRHKYHITDVGRDAFFAWLRGEDEPAAASRYEFMRRDEFLTRCNYIRHLEKPDALAIVGAEIERVQAVLADYNGARARMIEKKVDPYRMAILEYGIGVHESRLAWLESLAAAIKKDRRFPGPMCRKAFKKKAD